jgi:hypothetical protein
VPIRMAAQTNPEYADRIQHPNNEASRRPAPRPIRRSDRCREVARFSQ